MKAKFSKNKYLLNYWIPIFLVAINFVLKIIYLDKMSIANDEPFSIYIAQMDVFSIVSQLSKGNNPPLFEIILHYWISIFGISAFATRFLPFIFSVITVVYIYKIGISFFNHKIAIISSLIFTFSTYHIYFSHETRVYSLFALLTTISMYSYLSLVKNRSSKPNLAALTLANILLCYSHFFGIFIPIIQIVSCLILRDIRKKILKNYMISLLVLFISYIPYTRILILRFLDSTINGTWIPAVTFGDLYTMLWRFSNTPVTTVVYISIIGIAFVKLMLNRSDKPTVYTKIIIVWFLLPYFLMFISSLKYLPFNVPIFFDRYVIFISIGFYLVVAISIFYVIKPFKQKKYLLFLPIIIAIATCNPNVDNKRRVFEVISKIKELKTKDTYVYFSPDFFEFNFVYYYNLEYFKDYGNINLVSKIHENLYYEHIYPINNPNQIRVNADSHIDKILFLDALSQYPQLPTLAFEKKFKLVNTYKYYQIFILYEFEKR
ncbi:MAG: glycosyltransferase family 39 protein [Bacteroidota bacterium]